MISNAPLVSVVLPSYNHADFVTKAVASVLNQHLQNLELIIVDDGSTDGTPDIIEKIKDPRVRLIRLEQNRLIHPRNLALSIARGEYIAFQNSDDEWLPEKLQTQVDILNSRRNVVACFTDVELIDENGEIVTSSWANGLFTTENRTNIAWLHRFFTRGNCLCISSAVVRRKAINDIGKFHGSLIQISDFDMWVRLAPIGDFYIVNEKLTRFRIVLGKKVSAPLPPLLLLLRFLLRFISRFVPIQLKSKLKQLTGIRNLSDENVEGPKPGPSIVSSNNLSAPKVNSTNRSLLEFADILGNFVTPPILDLAPHIFEDVMPVISDSIHVRRAWLAKYAWSIGSAAHYLFADRVMASILENDVARKEVTDMFGAEIIRDFIQRRGQLSFRVEKGEAG